MKNVLILNGACKHFGHGGTLNQSFCDLAKRLLGEEGARVEVTLMAEYSDIDAECRKILDADIILLQSPIWAMGMPWPVKKYVDEVMTQPVVCGSDGRSPRTPGASLRLRRTARRKTLHAEHHLERLFKSLDAAERIFLRPWRGRTALALA